MAFHLRVGAVCWLEGKHCGYGTFGASAPLKDLLGSISASPSTPWSGGQSRYDEGTVDDEDRHRIGSCGIELKQQLIPSSKNSARSSGRRHRLTAAWTIRTLPQKWAMLSGRASRAAGTDLRERRRGVGWRKQDARHPGRDLPRYLFGASGCGTHDMNVLVLDRADRKRLWRGFGEGLSAGAVYARGAACTETE